jgi:hypothetical protein
MIPFYSVTLIPSLRDWEKYDRVKQIKLGDKALEVRRTDIIVEIGNNKTK